MQQLPEPLSEVTLGQPQPTIVQPAAVERFADRTPTPVGERRVVGYETYAGMLVPVYEVRQELARPDPRDLTPQPLIDPRAQVILASGLGTGAAAAGVGWGIGEAAAGLSSGGGLLLLCLLAAWKLSSSRGRGNTHITQTVHHHQKWFGRSTTNL